MKTLLTTLLLVLIYIPAFAQGPSIPEDPFTRHLLNNPNNPCEDSLYTKLQEIDLEEMTDRQFEIYKQKDQACQEYQKLLASEEAEKMTAESLDRSSRNITKYLIFSGIVTAASIIWLAGV